MLLLKRSAGWKHIKNLDGIKRMKKVLKKELPQDKKEAKALNKYVKTQNKQYKKSLSKAKKASKKAKRAGSAEPVPLPLTPENTLFSARPTSLQEWSALVTRLAAFFLL